MARCGWMATAILGVGVLGLGGVAQATMMSFIEAPIEVLPGQIVNANFGLQNSGNTRAIDWKFYGSNNLSLEEYGLPSENDFFEGREMYMENISGLNQPSTRLTVYGDHVIDGNGNVAEYIFRVSPTAQIGDTGQIIAYAQQVTASDGSYQILPNTIHDFTVVPEPATATLLLTSVLAGRFLTRRSRRRT